MSNGLHDIPHIPGEIPAIPEFLLTLADDLIYKHRTVDAVLSDLVFIVENSLDNLALKKYIKKVLTPMICHTLYIDRKVDRQTVLRVAAHIIALSKSQKTGTIPDAIEEITDPLCLSQNSSLSTQLTTSPNTTGNVKTFTAILTDCRLLLMEKLRTMGWSSTLSN